MPSPLRKVGPKRLLYSLAGCLLLLACHDASRENPFDPVLTPAVELSVVLDESTGTAALTWTPYQGKQPFSAYRILRHIAGNDLEDTLAVIDQVEQTTFTDAMLQQHVVYVYRIAVANTSAFEVLSEPRTIPPLILPGVRIDRAEFASESAQASLSWSPYAGPGFAAYCLLRRTANQSPQVIREFPNLTDTTYVDEGLDGNTEYFYQVAVLTDRGEQVAGVETSGIIYPLVAIWPLDIDTEGKMPDKVQFVPDRRNPDGPLQVLVAGTESVRTLYYDRQDGSTSEQVHLTRAEIDLAPAHKYTCARAVDTEGRSYLSLVSGGVLAVFPLGTDGKPVFADQALFTEAFPSPLTGIEATVQGEIALEVEEGNGNAPAFDRVEVSADGEQLFFDDFSAFPEDAYFRDENARGWELTGRHFIRNGRLEVGRTSTNPIGANPATARRQDLSWRDFQLETDVIMGRDIPQGRSFGIQIGGETYSRFSLHLDPVDHQALLRWTFNPPNDSDLEPRDELFTAPFPVIPHCRYHLELEVAQGRVRASIQRPSAWTLDLVREGILASSVLGDDFIYGCIIQLDEGFALTVNDQAFFMTMDGDISPLEPLDDWVYSLEVQDQRPVYSGLWIATCMPEINRIERWSALGNPSTWNLVSGGALGPFLNEKVALLYPLGIAVLPYGGPGYILDGWNSRVLTPVTQWGQKGSAPGEFDFGDGQQLDRGIRLTGSIAVDRDGYIYVADVYNRRIQKFAP